MKPTKEPKFNIGDRVKIKADSLGGEYVILEQHYIDNSNVAQAVNIDEETMLANAKITKISNIWVYKIEGDNRMLYGEDQLISVEPVNLEELISQRYNAYLAEQQRQQEELEAQRKIEEELAIAKLKQNIEKIFSLELQKALGMKFEFREGAAIATFQYREVVFVAHNFVVNNERWAISRAGKMESDYIRSSELLDYILLELGKIRAGQQDLD